MRLTSRFSKIFFGNLFIFGLLSACGERNIETSQPTVVNLPHTNVKWQSIGNCWIYAVTGWAESLVLKNTSGREVLNLSETYITYRHIQEQLQSRWVREVNTGGSWYQAVNLITNYGVMREEDFVPGEANAPRSSVQEAAVSYLNQSLRSGALSRSRDARTIDAELRTAFKLGNRSFESLIIPASKVTVETRSGRSVSLHSALSQWDDNSWPWSSWENRPHDEQPYVPSSLTAEQNQLMYRVKKAMNDGHPVIMSWFVDFNALDNQGIFSANTLKSRGHGHQGYHMTVLEDYTARGVDPQTGKEFFIGEGEVSDADKALALNYGNISYLVLKNSWGGNERMDRPSYTRDGSKGYHRLDASYLFSWIPKYDEKTNRFQELESVVTSFVLPPGY